MTNDPHAFPLADAVVLTARWRQQMPSALRAGRFDRIAVDNLLALPGAAGIRTYLAMEANGTWTFVMVATDADKNDILVSGMVAEIMDPCPPNCDVNSPLSQDPPA